MKQRFLTHHAGILLSHPGVGYLYPPSPPPIVLAPMLSLPTELLFYDNNNNNNKNKNSIAQ